MGMGTIIFVTRCVNFLTMLLGVAVICFGVWMSTHHDSCRKSLTLPVMALGAFILIISLIGFLGALKNITIFLWIYLALLGFILVGILVFTVLAFIITNSGTGHGVQGLKFKEYHLQDYSSWFRKQGRGSMVFYIAFTWIFTLVLSFVDVFQLNNTQHWEHLRSCLVKSDDCSDLSKKYKNLKQYKEAQLTPVQGGCCRPPSECGYPAVNASFYDLSFHPVSRNNDCKVYKNSKVIKCYNCDSCKAGVAQYMKKEWRVVATFNLFLFVVLSLVYFVGCCARRNAARHRSSKV